MLVTKTVIFMCLSVLGHSVDTTLNKTPDKQVSFCVDKVNQCYYTQNKDVFACIAKLNLESRP